jgi:hypothetical protein
MQSGCQVFILQRKVSLFGLVTTNSIPFASHGYDNLKNKLSLNIEHSKYIFTLTRNTWRQSMKCRSREDFTVVESESEEKCETHDNNVCMYAVTERETTLSLLFILWISVKDLIWCKTSSLICGIVEAYRWFYFYRRLTYYTFSAGRVLFLITFCQQDRTQKGAKKNRLCPSLINKNILSRLSHFTHTSFEGSLSQWDEFQSCPINLVFRDKKS